MTDLRDMLASARAHAAAGSHSASLIALLKCVAADERLAPMLEAEVAHALTQVTDSLLKDATEEPPRQRAIWLYRGARRALPASALLAANEGAMLSRIGCAGALARSRTPRPRGPARARARRARRARDGATRQSSLHDARDGASSGGTSAC